MQVSAVHLERGLGCQLGQTEEALADWWPEAWIFVKNVAGMWTSLLAAMQPELLERVTKQASHQPISPTLLSWAWRTG